jgi:hypothetical protein
VKDTAYKLPLAITPIKVKDTTGEGVTTQHRHILNVKQGYNLLTCVIYDFTILKKEILYSV